MIKVFKISFYSNTDICYEKNQSEREYNFYLSLNCKYDGRKACELIERIINTNKDNLTKTENKLQKKLFKRFGFVFNSKKLYHGDLVLIMEIKTPNNKQFWIKEPINGWRRLREEINSCLLH